jgi:hypothetical protein
MKGASGWILRWGRFGFVRCSEAVVLSFTEVAGTVLNSGSTTRYGKSTYDTARLSHSICGIFLTYM